MLHHTEPFSTTFVQDSNPLGDSIDDHFLTAAGDSQAVILSEVKDLHYQWARSLGETA